MCVSLGAIGFIKLDDIRGSPANLLSSKSPLWAPRRTAGSKHVISRARTCTRRWISLVAAQAVCNSTWSACAIPPWLNSVIPKSSSARELSREPARMCLLGRAHACPNVVRSWYNIWEIFLRDGRSHSRSERQIREIRSVMSCELGLETALGVRNSRKYTQPMWYFRAPRAAFATLKQRSVAASSRADVKVHIDCFSTGKRYLRFLLPFEGIVFFFSAASQWVLSPALRTIAVSVASLPQSYEECNKSANMKLRDCSKGVPSSSSLGCAAAQRIKYIKRHNCVLDPGFAGRSLLPNSLL